jgi:hypothetical protein
VPIIFFFFNFYPEIYLPDGNIAPGLFWVSYISNDL